jgi:hypothetical protein
VILPTGVRVSGRQLHVAECADQGNQATRYPHSEKQRHAAGVLGDELRGPKDAGAYNQADRQRDGIEGT